MCGLMVHPSEKTKMALQEAAEREASGAGYYASWEEMFKGLNHEMEKQQEE